MNRQNVEKVRYNLIENKICDFEYLPKTLKKTIRIVS